MPEPLDAGTSAPVAAPAAAPEAQGQTQNAAPQAATPAGGGHPAWDGLRSAIGDSTFTLIKPHLETFDRSAQDRISSLSSNLDRYTGLGEYEQLQQAMQLAQAIDADPAAFYGQYGEYLRTNGLLEAEAAPEGEIEDPESPFTADEPQEDPRIAMLMERFEQQEFEQQVSQQSQYVEQTLASIQQQNPWMTEEDTQEVISRAQAHLQAGNDKNPLEAAAAELVGLRTRYMSAPRAVAGAPKLIPAGGGNPAAAQQPNVGAMTPQQRQAHVVQMLTQNR